MSNSPVLQYNKIPLTYKKLNEAEQPIGTIFRICNKKNKSYIWYSENAEETIKHYIRQLSTSSFNNKEIQQDFNHNKNAFFFEDLAHYYNESELYHILASYANYYGGKNLDNLYNSSEIKEFLSNQRFVQAAPVIDNINDDSVIMQKIVEDPLAMLQVLTSFINTCTTYINEKYSELPSNQLTDISVIKQAIPTNEPISEELGEEKLVKDKYIENKPVSEESTTKKPSETPKTEKVDRNVNKTILEDTSTKLRQTKRAAFELKTIGENNFPYYKEDVSLKDYIASITPLLKNAPLFLQELNNEATKFTSTKMQVKDILHLRVKNIPITNIVKELQKRPEYRSLNNKNACASCDNLQILYPAIYLIYGFGAYSTKDKRPKRVMKELEKRGVTDAPML